MEWKKKARIAGLLDTIPLGQRAHYFVQRHITRSLPRKPKPEYFEILDWHLDNFNTHAGGLEGKRLFEFGAGWDLFYNIWLYGHGLDEQTVVDLNPYLKPELVNFEIKRMQEMGKGKVARMPEVEIRSAKDLEKLGITYLAPCDARDTGLPAGSFDLVVSTNTMEHIPHPDLALILKESFRLLKPGGVVSSKIDYTDHYFYTDKSIGPYNYMRFTDDEWRRYNPDGHFQNRGRHSDYVRLFTEAGFELIKSDPVCEYPDAAPPPEAERAPAFHNLNEVDLKTTAGYFCAVKP